MSTSQDALSEIIPQIDRITPATALPLAELEIAGSNLGPQNDRVPGVSIDDERADLLMASPGRMRIRVPEDGRTGQLVVCLPSGKTTSAAVSIGRKLSDGLHPVTSPAVSPSGMIYATISGSRGKMMPVSVVRISPSGQGTPFASGILNATGLAFNPDGELFVTSRAEGNVYRIDGSGEHSLYAEGMGVATGAAFDREGNLYVGDRSGTIFKIDPVRRIFVYATLEPSVSAYHLAFDEEGTLFVTGPTLSPNEAIWAIDRKGTPRIWFRGLGRPQGLAFDGQGRLHVAASLNGKRGLFRFTGKAEPERVVAASTLVGVAFTPQSTAVLATQDAVYDVVLSN